jgi:hypothetical protein
MDIKYFFIICIKVYVESRGLFMVSFTSNHFINMTNVKHLLVNGIMWRHFRQGMSKQHEKQNKLYHTLSEQFYNKYITLSEQFYNKYITLSEQFYNAIIHRRNRQYRYHNNKYLPGLVTYTLLKGSIISVHEKM